MGAPYSDKCRELWVMDVEIYLNEKLAPVPKAIFENYYKIWILGVDGIIVFLRPETSIFEVDLCTKRGQVAMSGV